MLYGSVASFVLAAMLGLYMVAFLFRNKEIPKGIAFIHGPLAVVALVLLVLYAFYESRQADLAISILLFVAAAAGGFVLFVRDLLRRPLPKWLAIVHALLAVAALSLVVVEEGVLR
jgi:hypothetical protein